jgi:hypothetical protein
MAFLEAFARGMPALAIRWFAVPEIVQHAHNGLLVDKPASLLSWMSEEGIPVMNRSDFVLYREGSTADLRTATALAEQIVMLSSDPSLLAHLSAGARHTVHDGKFSPREACANVERVAEAIAARLDL